MPEIKLDDIQEIKNHEAENFRNIKPEWGTTPETAKKYWDDAFSNLLNEKRPMNSEMNNERVYSDDNGKIYRRGDNLEPNCRFEVRGYTYETDNLGRTKSAEGKLRLRDSDYKRNMDDMSSVGKGDQKEDDQRGHLIAHQFGGSGGIENLSPMSGELNQKDYAKLENTLADAVKDGADVRLTVEPVYQDGSHRPSEYRVSYSIDGERDVVVFKNGKGE